MGFITRNLSSNERILKLAHLSYRYVFFGPVLYYCMFVTLGVLTSPLALHPAEGRIASVVVGFIYVFIPVLIRRLILRSTTEMVLTNQRVVFKSGIATQHTDEIYLDRIDGVVVTQSLAGRLFDYGCVEIRDVSCESIVFRWIDQPDGFSKAIRQSVQNRRFPTVVQYVEPLTHRRFEMN